MRLTVALMVVAVAAALLLLHPRPAAASSWAEVNERIHRRFPAVNSLTTGQLAARLADPTRPPPLLLDARAPEEYAVSHLHGALLAPNLAAARALLADRPPGAEVVVYCSVGYRSAELVEALQQAGYHELRNLEGSIFQWANEGRPVYREQGRDDGRDGGGGGGGDGGSVQGGAGEARPVRAVHPYDRHWGELLNRDLWSWRGGE